MHDFRLMIRNLALIILGKAANNDQIARRNQMCGCAIDTNCTAVRRSRNRIGDQTISVVNIENVHLLVVHNLCGLQQVDVNRHASFIV